MKKKIISLVLIFCFTLTNASYGSVQVANSRTLRTRGATNTDLPREIVGAMHEGTGAKQSVYYQLKYDPSDLAAKLALQGIQRQDIKSYEFNVDVPVIEGIDFSSPKEEDDLFDHFFGPTIEGIAAICHEYGLELNQNNLRVFVRTILERVPEKKHAILKRLYQETMGKTLTFNVGNIDCLAKADLNTYTFDIDAGLLLAVKNHISVEILIATILSRDFFGYVCGVNDDEQLNITDAENTIVLFDKLETETANKKQGPDATAFFQAIFKALYDVRIRQTSSFSYIDCLQATVKKKEYAIPDLIGGRYKPLAVLGEGGMGIVFLAKNIETGSKVAVKITKGDEEELGRFIKEVRLIKDVNHPYVISIESFNTYGEEGNRHAYYAMRYCPWPSLDDLLDEDIGAPNKELGQPSLTRRHPDKYSMLEYIEILNNVLLGLDAVHKQQLVHRDLKPENIKFDRRTKTPVIMDFGLVKSLKDTAGGLTTSAYVLKPTGNSRVDSGMHTMKDTAMGTPQYMSPEQAQDAGSVDTRADIYSMGVILYHMMTGYFPFEGRNVHEILNNVITKNAQAPSQLNPAIDKRLESIILKAMDKNPDKRFQSAEEMRSALEQYLKYAEALQRQPGAKKIFVAPAVDRRKSVRKDQEQPGHEVKKDNKYKTPIIAASVAAAVVLGGIGIAVLASKKPTPPPQQGIVNVQPQPQAESKLDKQIKESEVEVAQKLAEMQAVVQKAKSIKDKIDAIAGNSSQPLAAMKSAEKNKDALEKKKQEIQSLYENAKVANKNFDTVKKEASDAQKGVSEATAKLTTLLAVKDEKPKRDYQKDALALAGQVDGLKTAGEEAVAGIKGNLQAAEALAQTQMSDEEKKLALAKGFARELNEKLEKAKAQKDEVDALSKKVSATADELGKTKNITAKAVADITTKPSASSYETAEGIIKATGDLEAVSKSLPDSKEKSEKSKQDIEALDNTVKTLIASIKEKGLSEQDKELEGLLAQLKNTLEAAAKTSQDLPKKIQEIESLISDLKGHLAFANALVKTKSLEESLKQVKATIDKGKTELSNVKDMAEREKKRKELAKVEEDFNKIVADMTKIKQALLKDYKKAVEVLTGNIIPAEQTITQLKDAAEKATAVSSAIVWKWDGKNLDGWENAKKLESLCGNYRWEVDAEGVLKGVGGAITLPIRNIKDYNLSFAAKLQEGAQLTTWLNSKQGKMVYVIILRQKEVVVQKGSIEEKWNLSERVVEKSNNFTAGKWYQVDILVRNRIAYVFFDNTFVVKYNCDNTTESISFGKQYKNVELKNISITSEILKDWEEKIKKADKAKDKIGGAMHEAVKTDALNQIKVSALRVDRKADKIYSNVFSILGLKEKQFENRNLIFSADAFKQIGALIPTIAFNTSKRVFVAINEGEEYIEEVIGVINEQLPDENKILVIKEKEYFAVYGDILYFTTDKDKVSWIEELARNQHIFIQVRVLTKEITRSLGTIREISDELEQFKSAMKVLEEQT